MSLSFTFTSSLLSGIAGSSSSANQFVTDLNQLAKDLESGNLPAAKVDFVTLSQDAQSGAGTSTATSSTSGITTTLLSDIAGSSSSSSSFVSELNQLGNDLQSGTLGSAQQDLLSLDSTALGAASSIATPSSSATSANQAETVQLIKAIVSALGVGNGSAASTGLSELASVSSNSKGASYLENLSQSLDSSSSSSSSSPISQLLQSLNSSSSNGSSSILNVLG